MPGSGLYTFENIAVNVEYKLCPQKSLMVFAVLSEEPAGRQNSEFLSAREGL
jgi:hypothetical protein